MNNRIEAIVSCIEKHDKVIDIGCDQVELGIMLANNGIKSVACDISEKVISKANEKIKNLNLDKFIKLKVSNGLENIFDEDLDTAVLAGMGTYTIIDILSKSKINFKKIITISNNNNDVLRIKMSDLGYKINSELVIYEKDKYYNLIKFIPGYIEYTEQEILLGYNHKNTEIYKNYLIYLLKKYQKIILNSKDQNEKIKKILDYINL